MKIKVQPDDFVVRELADLPLSEEGGYRVYIMQKRGWNTVDAVESVARASGVSPSLIKYAGLKDRHALTSQHLSVPREHDLRSSVPALSLTLAGFSDESVSTRVLLGNAFEITVRSLNPAEVERVQARLPEVRLSGFPNYFDDQRFGSVTERGEFLGERLVEGHLRGALRLYLTAEYPGHRKVERQRRQAVSSAWGKWAHILPLCRTPAEKAIVQALMRGGNRKNLLAGINAVPHVEMAMYIAAFQSLVWNRSLQILLERSGVLSAQTSDPLAPLTHPEHLRPAAAGASSKSTAFAVAGKAGPYAFYRDLPETVADVLRGRRIPSVARRLLPAADDVVDAVMSALAERGLSLADLNLRGIRSSYFKSFYRQAIVVPGDLFAWDVEPDDLYRGRSKVRLAFSLPPGSYATMLLKALAGGPADGKDPGQDKESTLK